MQTRWYKAAANTGAMRGVQIGNELFDEKALAARLAGMANEVRCR